MAAIGLLYWIFTVGCLLSLWLLPQLPLDARKRQCLAALDPAATLGYGAFVERNRIELAETEIAVSDLSEGLDSIRIVQLSDIRCRAFFGARAGTNHRTGQRVSRPHRFVDWRSHFLADRPARAARCMRRGALNRWGFACFASSHWRFVSETTC